MGIPISFMGAFCLLPWFDVTINMISLFAFIVVLGVVVDDAIVVGENIFSYRQKGMDPVAAAIRGVLEMATPVTVAILTTVVAFMPLLFTSGDIGKIVRVIPVVVISVLLVSLVEAMLILPAHLSGPRRRHLPGSLTQFHSRVHQALDRFTQGPYMRALRWAIGWRYLTIAMAMALFAITIGFVAGGHIKFVFFEMVDSDNVVAELTMPQGTPIEQTRAVVKQIEEGATRVRQQLDSESVTSQPSVFKHVSTTVGQQPFKRMAAGPGNRNFGSSLNNAHLAEINIELVSAEYRNMPAQSVENLWRQEVGEIAGISSLVFQSAFFSVGEAINVELSHPDFETTLSAVRDLKERLRQYQGVSDIENSFLPGKREIRLSLKDEGRTLGLTLADVALQVRHAFYGAEAQRIQRGRDDLKVMVRYPEAQRSSVADVSTMRLRLPDGTEVPFQAVAQMHMGRGYAQIDRADRRRIVRVTADVDESLPGVSSGVINGNLAAVVLPQLQQHYPGLLFEFEGEQAEQSESMGESWILLHGGTAGNLLPAWHTVSQLPAAPDRHVGDTAGLDRGSNRAPAHGSFPVVSLLLWGGGTDRCSRQRFPHHDRHHQPAAEPAGICSGGGGAVRHAAFPAHSSDHSDDLSGFDTHAPGIQPSGSLPYSHGRQPGFRCPLCHRHHTDSGPGAVHDPGRP